MFGEEGEFFVRDFAREQELCGLQVFGMSDEIDGSVGVDHGHAGGGFAGESQAESIRADDPPAVAVANLRRPSAATPTIRTGPGRIGFRASSLSVTELAVGPPFFETTGSAVTPS